MPLYQPKRKVSNYLLNKSLQLRYVAFVTVLSALLSGVLGFLIWRQETYASDKILATFNSSEFAEDPELGAAIVERLTSYDGDLVKVMSLAGVGLMLVLSVYLIVMTHKVAGPLYKVGLYFDQMAEGRLGPTTPLRRGDMLVEFFEAFRASHAAIRQRHVAHNQAVGRLLAACDAAGVGIGGPLGVALEDLRAHHAQRSDALG